MATYDEILDTQLDPDAPITSSLGYQLRDNPIAIAEGAVGAPRVLGRALNLIERVENFTGGSNPRYDLDLTGLETLLFVGRIFTNGNADSFYIGLSDDGGSTISATTLISNLADTVQGIGNFYMDLTTGLFCQLGGNGSYITLALPSGPVDTLVCQSSGSSDAITTSTGVLLNLGIGSA